jgi:anthranilate synthase component 1
MAAWFFACWIERNRVSRLSTVQSGQCLTHELSRPIDFRALHKSNFNRYPFLLQSTATKPSLGQFDILFAYPGQSLTLSDLDHLSGPGSDAQTDFLAALDNWWRQEKGDDYEPPPGTPFHGGWFIYLGYELAAQVEPSLKLQPDELLPTAFAVRCPAAFVHDHETGQQSIVYEAGNDDIRDAMINDASSLVASEHSTQTNSRVSAQEEDSATFIDAVKQAKEYIAAGDIFQANVSRRWVAGLNGERSADDVYARLCEVNPAPFAGLIRWNDVAVISSSPERLVRILDSEVSTRPIAGTRPRGISETDDQSLTEELFSHPKERAEHVMLIDLERNDLGRVCEAGTIEVNEHMVLESYAHVHHIVSNVRGTLKKNLGPADVIRAVFPGGTITGCPKVRCMEIINELEKGPRGAYTGSFGYLNRNGSLDLNILIRTMVMSDNKIELKAGSGIVADSDPEAELAETQAKAKGLLMALA